MINIIKEEIEIEESLESRLRVICDFCNTTPTIINGSIRRIDKTNLTYVEPHRITIKGNLYLVKGNHDRINAEMSKRFVWIKDYAEIKDNGRNVVLCHYPIAHWRNADYGTIHLYGHIHAGRDSRPFDEYKELMKQRNIPYECYNVGCMLSHMDYTPRTLDEIIESLK